MLQEARDAERPNHLPVISIKVFRVVVNKPVDAEIGHHVNTGVIKRSHARQDNGRTIRLGRVFIEHGFHIIEQSADRNFFIRIVASKINAHERNELDFRMLQEDGSQRIRCELARFDHIKKIFLIHSFITPFLSRLSIDLHIWSAPRTAIRPQCTPFNKEAIREN